MSPRQDRLGFRVGYRAQGAWLAALAASGVLAFTLPVSAQFFDLFGNNNRRWTHPPAYADPYQFNPFGQRASETPRVEAGGATAFCVRTCDGRYFPIARNTGATPAQTCSALCPAAATKIYHGSSIDHASANGQRYADLSTAFVYREKIVPGCSCNGKDAFGIVTPSVTSDPTLHTGDIVATNEGLVAVTGTGRKQTAEFTPVQSYSGLPAELRQRLADTKVVPSDTAPVTVTVKPAAETTASVMVSKNKRAQAEPRPAAQQQRSRWWFW